MPILGHEHCRLNEMDPAKVTFAVPDSQREQLVRRFRVTVLDSRQESCNVAHCRIVLRQSTCCSKPGRFIYCLR